jgi:hypothetical protein
MVVLLRLLLNQVQQLLDDLRQVWLISQSVPSVSRTDLGNVLLPISLISHLFQLEVSDLLDLVVVNDQALAIVGLSLQVLFGKRACVWLLEADEAISVVGLSLFKLHVFDISERLEQIG